MGFRGWLGRSADNVRSHGVDGLFDSLYELYTGAWRYLGWHIPRGVNIYDREWDALVILDACRVDVIREVESEYPFINGIESVESVGSMSQEWLAKTFTARYRSEIENTAYVTSNVFSEEVLGDMPFLLLDEVWKYGWDDEAGTVPPSPITERAVAVGREYEPEYLIIHYMQPHHPFIGSDLAADFESDPFGNRNEKTVVDALRKGEISKDEFWHAYRDNLRLVLDEVASLLTNLDADTVVLTADHGEAFGEWGIYGHPAGALHPVVKNVPWIETTATDTFDIEPTIEPMGPDSADAKRRLEELGYL